MAKTRFEVYKDKAGTYRWKLLSQNGEAVANGGEAYASKNGAMSAVKKLKDWSKTKDIVDVEKTLEMDRKAKEKAKADKIKLSEKTKADKIKSDEKAKLAKAKAGKKSKKTVSSKKKNTTDKVNSKPLQTKKVNSKTTLSKDGKSSKAETTKKSIVKNKTKKIVMPIDEADIHIVNRADRYDGITVAEAISNAMNNEDKSLM